MTTESQEFTEVQFSASALWARRSWIFAGALLGALLAVAFVLAQPETNRSWAQVLVRPLGVDLTRGPVNVNQAVDVVAERELAGSFVVAERTAERVSADIGPRELRREVEIATIEDSLVLEFSYADEDATLARDISQAFAESYLEIRAELGAEAVGASRAALEARQIALLDERQALIAARADLSDDGDDRLLNFSAETVVTNQLAAVENDIALLDALTSDPGDVISPAQVAERSERPRLVPMFVAGGFLGGLLALLAAVFVDRGLRDRDLDDDALEALGLTPFAHLPRDARGADAFASLERRVSGLMGEAQVLAMTTVAGSDAAAQVAPWFAWNLADSGRRVLLVSADFSGDSIASQFGLPVGPGLTDALVGGSDPDDVVKRVGNLHVITSGSHPGDPTGVLQMVGMSRFLNRARRVYDIVVIHAPELTRNDSSLLASWPADVVTVVIDSDQRNALQQISPMLRRTDARVLGAVVLAPMGATPANR